MKREQTGLEWLTRSGPVSGPEEGSVWFADIAARLLNGWDLSIRGEPYRLAEIEFYHYSPPGHADPFAHRNPIQRLLGRWCFHRAGREGGGSYRGGSFKGLDLTFGDGQAFGGILIRGFVAPDGALIDGPSLCVDHLLARAGVERVADLDGLIAERTAWDEESPLVLTPAVAPRSDRVFRSARVGLALKQDKTDAEAVKFALWPYRFLTEPKRIAKGKIHLALALHAQGHSLEEIVELTGCARLAAARYIADCRAGRSSPGFAEHFHADLNPVALCRLHGAWSANYGEGC